MNLQKRSYVLVTGASRGIGREMALQLASRVQPEGSLLVLLGRSQSDLDATKALILANSSVSQLSINSYILELSTATAADFERILMDSLQGSADNMQFERAIIIHNAGTLGDTSLYAREIGNTDVLQQYYHTNLFSAISLNCVFMRVFAQLPKLVVNLSTKAAVEPFPSMAYYCTVKAAREMYFRVLAAEEPEAATLVLNYAPGVIDTQMTEKVQRETHDKALAQAFREQRESKTMLTTKDTVLKFIQILQQQTFKSGDHVDFWD